MSAGDSVAGDAVVHSDALLQMSRRLDWRFLLPVPTLGAVAYIGPPQGALVEALRRFCAVLTVVDVGADVPLAGYDVVVVVAPSWAVLRWAVALVRPGGFVYVEGFGMLWLRRYMRGGVGSRPRSAVGCVSLLSRVGMEDVGCFWHWPSFEGCTEIVPLDDSGALRFALTRRRDGWVARVAAGLLARSGVLGVVVPCYSVVARRPFGVGDSGAV